ncbi:MAG: arginine--tRNA ligase [Holosporales bacterium]|nr:arginine--tRNA ligase [Holosporales bacterium]
MGFFLSKSVVLQGLRKCIFSALKQFSDFDKLHVSEDTIFIDQPNDDTRGDLYTNTAMLFAKRLGTSPTTLAGVIKDFLLQNSDVTEVSVANQGFVNFRLKSSSWQAVVGRIITNCHRYSYSNLKNGASLNIEFVSANPTGPLHTGHARNAVFGSVAAKLLERIGYNVVREFYINDEGNQITLLAKSLYLRYCELLGVNVNGFVFEDGMYFGEYVKDMATELREIYGDEFLNKDESEWLITLRSFAVKKMMDNIKNDLSLLGVSIDIYTSEAALYAKQLENEAIDILTKRGDIYEGVLPKPKGMTKDDDSEWSEKPQTLFRSTKYGDDIDRTVRKFDGTWTYFAGDIAYHLDKIKRGYKKMVIVLGADHCGYVKRLKAVTSALSNNDVEIEVRLYQLVNFLENGRLIKMSKRAGNFITLKDVVSRCGKDITRYMMVSRHHDVMIDFDFVKAVEQSLDNPIFYIQYAYARICSVFKNCQDIFGNITHDDLVNCDKSALVDDSEITLMKALTLWPEQVRAAALAIEPHRISHYLQNIAHLFHVLWNRGKVNTKLRFIDQKSRQNTLARLSLLQATKNVLEDGFDIIDITPMSEMK